MRTIETARLRLLPFTWDDFNFLYQLNADPDVARHIGTGKPRSEEESREWMDKTLRWYEEDDSGHLAVLLKESSLLIGRCGLSTFEVEAPAPHSRGPLRCFWGRGSAPDGMKTDRISELGYSFAKEHWGKGYATEAARAVRDDAFGVQQKRMLMSLIAPANLASKRVAIKLGLRRFDEVEVFSHISERFLLNRAEWRQMSSES